MVSAHFQGILTQSIKAPQGVTAGSEIDSPPGCLGPLGSSEDGRHDTVSLFPSSVMPRALLHLFKNLFYTQKIPPNYIQCLRTLTKKIWII